MSLLTIVPLLFAVLVSVATAMQVLKRKSLAQSHCIFEAVQIQNRLREILTQLLKLNPRAKVLRARRAKADRAVRIAESSKHPAAIAITRAAQMAVILEQLALKAEQNQLLTEAQLRRDRGFRQLKARLNPTQHSKLATTPRFPRGLAVVPKPPASLSPDYEPVPRFTYFQQQNFSFNTDLYPDSGWVQPTECSVSLQSSEDQWKIRILAANASSS